MAAWAARVAEHPRMLALAGAYRRWAHNTARAPNPSFPFARLTLIHTFSHMLIRQVALECGYSSASIRERLYIGTPEAPAAGVLLSTAASDSEGTLGGLVALGHRTIPQAAARQRFRGRGALLLRPAVRRACSLRDRRTARRRVPCVPVRLRDHLRDQQPLAGPGRAGRSRPGADGLAFAVR